VSPHTTSLSSLLDTGGPDRSHWLELPARRESVRAARHGVSACLRSWRVPAELCADAVLLVSELVTNAVVHTLSSRVLCGVALIGEERLRVEVHDYDNAALSPTRGRPTVDCETGRGLLIVQEVADTWGAERSTRTKGNVVWATLRGA